MWEGVKGRPVKAAAVFNKRAKDLADEKITERAVAYIGTQAKARQPFFLYVSLLQIHPPMGVHPDFAGKSGGALYADCPTEIDHRVGQIVDAIDAAGIADDTIVVFSSDNAAGHVAGMTGGSNGPWRGRLLQPALRRKLPGSGHGALARGYRGRTAERGTVLRRGLAADARGTGRGIEARSRRPSYRRDQCR